MFNMETRVHELLNMNFTCPETFDKVQTELAQNIFRGIVPKNDALTYALDENGDFEDLYPDEIVLFREKVAKLHEITRV